MRSRGGMDWQEPPTAGSDRHLANRPVIVLLGLLAAIVSAVTGVIMAIQSQAHPATGAPPAVPQTTTTHRSKPHTTTTRKPVTGAKSPSGGQTRTTSSPAVPLSPSPAPQTTSRSSAGSSSPAVPFRIASISWDSSRRTGPTTAEPGTAVDVHVTVDPSSATVNVSCKDLSTGKRVYLDIGSTYTCILQGYDAIAGKHTIQATVIEQRTGYTQSKSISFTLTA